VGKTKWLTNGQLSLAHGTERKNKEKIKREPISSEETVQAKVREGSPVCVCVAVTDP